MADESAARRRRLDARHRHNTEFFERLAKRRPSAKDAFEEATKRFAGRSREAALERVAEPEEPAAIRQLALETIVFEERPVLFVQDDWINLQEATIKGAEAAELIDQVETRRAVLDQAGHGPAERLGGRGFDRTEPDVADLRFAIEHVVPAPIHPAKDAENGIG